ncbi:MAG TPA: hypothetical protein VGM67_03770 [Gemmatimonadaceae bacterium]|jgi:hypothetical protein
MAADGGSQRSIRKLSHAAQLLLRLVATGGFDLAAIAAELVVPVATVESYLNGNAPMTTDRQLCLARFVIDRVPPLARQGHRLLRQVQATVAYQAHITETHAVPPPRTPFW